MSVTLHWWARASYLVSEPASARASSSMRPSVSSTTRDGDVCWASAEGGGGGGTGDAGGVGGAAPRVAVRVASVAVITPARNRATKLLILSVPPSIVSSFLGIIIGVSNIGSTIFFTFYFLLSILLYLI